MVNGASRGSVWNWQCSVGWNKQYQWPLAHWCSGAFKEWSLQKTVVLQLENSWTWILNGRRMYVLYIYMHSINITIMIMIMIIFRSCKHCPIYVYIYIYIHTYLYLNIVQYTHIYIYMIVCIYIYRKHIEISYRSLWRMMSLFWISKRSPEAGAAQVPKIIIFLVSLIMVYPTI